MADVFISYASSDRPIAEAVARALEKSGLSVWWDRHIKGGSEFTRDIEQQLDSARHVLVLWSKEAVQSRWVRDEASVAADTRRLVAATIDGTPAPLGFRQFQTIDLKGWRPDRTSVPRELLDALDGDASTAPEAGNARRRKLPALAVAAVLAAVAVGGVAIFRPPPFDGIFSGERQADEVALAIMPFAVQGGGDVDYLGAGLSSALADSLAPLSGIKFTASTSTQALAGEKLTATEIGDRLKVSHLVEGNVQRSGDRLAISVRLVDAADSEQLWTRGFEGPAADLQLLKAQITRELAGALRARLGVGQGDVVERGKVDPKAYAAYLRGLERVSVRDDRNARVEAIQQFRLAATIEPGFAEAHAGHAYLMALSMPHHLGLSWRDLVATQRRATDRALALDPENDLAWVARSTALMNFEGKADEANAIGRRVLARSPNFGPAHYALAASLWARGQSREALEQIDLAIDRDPFDTLLRFYRARILYSLGDYQGVREAALQCSQGCALNGWFWVMAMAGFADEATYREDMPKMEELARKNGILPADLADARGVAEFFLFGKDYPLKPIEPGGQVEFADAAIDGRMIGFEAGLRAAKRALDESHADSVLDILNAGRVTLTPDQRADPRYHALFRHPKIAPIAAARRRRGIHDGLPVFPVKPYTGP